MLTQQNPVHSTQSSPLQRSLQILALTAASLPGISASAWGQTQDKPYDQPQGSAHVEQAHRVNEVVAVSNLADYIQKWNPQEQVYVQGNVGLSSQQLQLIATFLKAHPHWSVYLVQQARGESYTGPDGQQFRNVDAILQGIRTGVAQKPEFDALVHPAKNLRDGAVIMISFDSDPAQRKVSYYSSDLQSQLGCGWEAWPNNLDQIAIRKLKQGRDVVGAVTDAVTHIDNLVARGTKPAPKEADASPMPERAENHPETRHSETRGERPEASPPDRDSADNARGNISPGVTFGIIGGLAALTGLAGWGIAKRAASRRAEGTTDELRELLDKVSSFEDQAKKSSASVESIFPLPELASGATEKALKAINAAKSELTAGKEDLNARLQKAHTITRAFHLGTGYADEVYQISCGDSGRKEAYQICRDLRTVARELQANVDAITTAVAALPTQQAQLTEKAATIESKARHADEATGELFKFKELIIPAVATLKELPGQAPFTDPVSTSKQATASLARIDVLTQVCDEVSGSSAPALTAIAANLQELQKRSVTPSWFDSHLSEIGASLARTIESGTWEPTSFRKLVETAKEKLDSARKTADKLTHASTNLGELHAALASTEGEIATLLGVRPQVLFQDSPRSPQSMLDESTKAITAGQGKLGTDLNAAQEGLGVAEQTIATARAEIDTVMGKLRQIGKEKRASEVHFAALEQRFSELAEFRADTARRYQRHSLLQDGPLSLDAVALEASDGVRKNTALALESAQAGNLNLACLQFTEARENLRTFEAEVAKLEGYKSNAALISAKNVQTLGSVMTQLVEVQRGCSSINYSSRTEAELARVEMLLKAAVDKSNDTTTSPFAFADGLSEAQTLLTPIPERAKQEHEIATTAKEQTTAINETLADCSALFAEVRGDKRLSESLAKRLETLTVIERDAKILADRTAQPHENWQELREAAVERNGELTSIVAACRQAVTACKAIKEAEESAKQAREWNGRRANSVRQSAADESTFTSMWQLFLIGQYVSVTAQAQAANTAATAAMAAASASSHSHSHSHSHSSSSSSSWSSSTASYGGGMGFGGGGGIASSGFSGGGGISASGW